MIQGPPRALEGQIPPSRALGHSPARAGLDLVLSNHYPGSHLTGTDDRAAMTEVIGNGSAQAHFLFGSRSRNRPP